MQTEAQEFQAHVTSTILSTGISARLANAIVAGMSDECLNQTVEALAEVGKHPGKFTDISRYRDIMRRSIIEGMAGAHRQLHEVKARSTDTLYAVPCDCCGTLNHIAKQDVLPGTLTECFACGEWFDPTWQQQMYEAMAKNYAERRIAR